MVDVLVIGDPLNGDLDPVYVELIAAARNLGGSVVAALIGDFAEDASQGAIAAGADTVYLVKTGLPGPPTVDVQVAAFEQVCRRLSPGVVLMGKTISGRDVAPRLACRLDTGLAQDCVEVNSDPTTGRLIATRPVFGGDALAVVTFAETDPQIAVLRPGAYEALPRDSSRSGEIVPLEVEVETSAIKVRQVDIVQEESTTIRLEDAHVVVSGGRGMGGPEPFEQLRELSRLLGGALGASRAVCDAGWLDHGHQIGLTGKTIAPDLYITVGTSGASQHMAGCAGAKRIVAINHDSDANIFKEAAYGVVGEWENVLPTFIKTVRELNEQ